MELTITEFVLLTGLLCGLGLLAGYLLGFVLF